MTRSSLSPASRVVDERTTPIYRFQLLQEDGTPILDTQLDSLRLTLYNKTTRETINGRLNQSVLNANNVTMSHSSSAGGAAGLVEWRLQPADTAIQSAELQVGALESHVALFVWTWDNNTQRNRLEVELLVRQMERVSGS